MFNGTADIFIKTEKSKDEVISLIQENLEIIGETEISDNGQISINAKRFSSFAHESTIEGSVKEKDGKYTIIIDYAPKINTVGWIVAIGGVCLAGFGILLTGGIVVAFVLINKNEIKKKIEKALDTIKYEFK